MRALIARLVELGLVYAIVHQTRELFVISPHLRFAIAGPSTSSPWANAAALEEGATGFIGRFARRSDERDTIITESNFRLYVYTTNQALLNVVKQFAVVKAEVPESGLVCCVLNRASVVKAVQKGMTAAQIARFLTLRAHPVMRQAAVDDLAPGLLVPQAVVDQLNMWESECHRVVDRRGAVLLSGISSADTERVVRILEQQGMGSSVWSKSPGYLVLSSEGYRAVQHMIKV